MARDTYLVQLSVPAAQNAPGRPSGPLADEDDEQVRSRTAREDLKAQVKHERLQKELLLIEQNKLQLQNRDLARELLECKDKLQYQIEARRQDSREFYALRRQLEKAEKKTEDAMVRLAETLEHVNRLQAKLCHLHECT